MTADDPGGAHRFWVSWYSVGAFTYPGPWWISGSDACGALTICAAVLAESKNDAKAVIILAHDEPTVMTSDRWRFVDEQKPDWSPFSDRFPRADWMEWPDV